MVRLLLKLLFGIDYDPCKNCQFVKEQLEYERLNNRELLETLTSLMKPQVIIQPQNEMKPIQPRHQIWTRRRAELERLDREAAQIRNNSKVMAKPDDAITKLEEEVDLFNNSNSEELGKGVQ